MEKRGHEETRPRPFKWFCLADVWPEGVRRSRTDSSILEVQQPANLNPQSPPGKHLSDPIDCLALRPCVRILTAISVPPCFHCHIQLEGARRVFFPKLANESRLHAPPAAVRFLICPTIIRHFHILPLAFQIK